MFIHMYIYMYVHIYTSVGVGGGERENIKSKKKKKKKACNTESEMMPMSYSQYHSLDGLWSCVLLAWVIFQLGNIGSLTQILTHSISQYHFCLNHIFIFSQEQSRAWYIYTHYKMIYAILYNRYRLSKAQILYASSIQILPTIRSVISLPSLF